MTEQNPQACSHLGIVVHCLIVVVGQHTSGIILTLTPIVYHLSQFQVRVVASNVIIFLMTFSYNRDMASRQMGCETDFYVCWALFESDDYTQCDVVRRS